MNKTKYKVRHIACNMNDFYMDCHRFRFEYLDKEYVLPCYGGLTIDFSSVKGKIPENVLLELQTIIWNKIENEETKWHYPKEAYQTAKEYCEKEFDIQK